MTIDRAGRQLGGPQVADFMRFLESCSIFRCLAQKNTEHDFRKKNETDFIFLSTLKQVF
jgi:hypothetical protein